MLDPKGHSSYQPNSHREGVKTFEVTASSENDGETRRRCLKRTRKDRPCHSFCIRLVGPLRVTTTLPGFTLHNCPYKPDVKSSGRPVLQACHGDVIETKLGAR